MKFTQLAGAAMTATLVALLYLPEIQGEEPADIPVAKPVSAAELESSVVSESTDEPETAAKPISAPEPETTVVLGSAAEPKMATKPVSTPEPEAAAKPISIAKPISTEEPVATDVTVLDAEVVGEGDGVLAPEMTLSPEGEGVLTTGEDPIRVNPAEADRNEDGELTQRELTLQNHREQLEIYDLNNDNKISKEEWKAANKENRTRDEKFFLVDKDEDGAITEDEAVGFLMQRISLNSTYLDANGEEDTDFNEREIQENAPSEVRVTLFSIPFGDK